MYLFIYLSKFQTIKWNGLRDMNQIKNAYAAQWSNPKNTNQKPNHEERI